MNQDHSAAEVNSTDSTKRDKWNAYMRDYRKRKKLATAPAIAIGSDMGTPEPAAPEEQSIG